MLRQQSLCSTCVSRPHSENKKTEHFRANLKKVSCVTMCSKANLLATRLHKRLVTRQVKTPGDTFCSQAWKSFCTVPVICVWIAFKRKNVFRCDKTFWLWNVVWSQTLTKRKVSFFYIFLLFVFVKKISGQVLVARTIL